ncbi:TRAP transporter small permease [Prosthecomicrobium sp. N25]|uniref:TRAP transporter small permease n=1 Tax=Prosthecomicrobium sp. N25 TaxID=3129254 RepID=UPI0030782273
MASSDSAGAWRRFTAWYHRILLAMLALLLGVLIIPVTLQIFSRFTHIIPHYIWTEEMARFLFVWAIMIGSIVGVREWTHFDVDVWPRLGRKADAALRLVARTGVLAIAFVFLIEGYEFTDQAIYRISELAELPLWIIHVAWPLTGASWILFLAEHYVDDFRALTGRHG